MTAVIAAKQPDLQFKLPRLVFEGGFIPYEPNFSRTYDVASDERFLMIEPPPTTSGPLTIVLNWAEELRRLVPAKQRSIRCPMPASSSAASLRP